MFDVVVIGGGIMGAPAARKLAQRSLRVALIAAPEPDEPAAHRGVFGAHQDVSRLTWHRHTDPVHEHLSKLALDEMRELDAQHGAVLGTRGFLFVAAPGRDEGSVAHLMASGLQPLDGERLAHRFPQLSFPTGVTGFHDPATPGWFDPRRLVALEQAMAREAGAEIVDLEAVGLDLDRMTVSLSNGAGVSARQVLIAAGAFSNRPGLLPRPLALRLKQESVCTAELDEVEAQRLGDLPAMVYQVADPSISDVYAAPPVEYPDGGRRLKWGANTLEDRWVESFDAIGDWYRGGGSAGAELIRPVMERHVPRLRASAWHAHRCVVTYTTHGKPYIDEIEEGRLFVAVGGNGHSAKWSPALGGLAADVVNGVDWPSGIPREAFAAQTAPGGGTWAVRGLWSERAAVSR